MKKNLTVIYIFICFSTFAQVPGYMGQRWAVYGDVALSPAYYKQYLANDVFNRSPVHNWGLNCRYEISTDLTFNKSQALGISLKHITTTIPFAYYTTKIPENVIGYELASYTGDVRLNANFISFYVKIFPFKNKGSIAPVGHYNKLEFAIGTAKAKTGKYVRTQYSSSDYYDYENETLILTDFEYLNYQREKPMIGLLYSFGNQIVVFDKGIFDLNTQIGWITPVSIIDGGLTANNEGSTETIFEENVAERINGTFFLNITIGFGYFLM
ncbi:MAG: hypothetical protein ACHQFW_08340 [Chitinophagales bacterium]